MTADQLFDQATEQSDAGNYKKAAQLFRAGAMLKLASCMNSYATMLESGLGVPKNLDEAIYWYRRAFRLQRAAYIAENIGDYYFKLCRSDLAFAWMKRAVALGSGDAALTLAQWKLSKSNRKNALPSVIKLLEFTQSSNDSVESTVRAGRSLLRKIRR